MTNFSPLKQEEFKSHRLNLYEYVGYPLWLEVNSPNHTRPLYWQSQVEEGQAEDSQFLQAPGLPLKILIPQKELASLPEEVVKLAFCLPEKHYQLMQAMLVSSAAMELALSSRLLFILLVLDAEKQNLDETSFKALVLKKRTQLLKHLKLPATASLVRLLARTNLSTTYLYDLEAVTSVLKRPHLLRLLQQIQQPCLQHFIFLRFQDTQLTSNLLNLITPATTPDEAENIARTVRDCFSLGAQKNQLASITSLSHLDALHDRLIHQYNRQHITDLAAKFEAEYGEYPPPPLPGNEIVFPITNWADLLLEGQDMKHCVGSYQDRISQGRVYIYQAQTNNRLTFSLVARGKQWVLDEIRGIANTHPSQEDLDLIHQWYRNTASSPYLKNNQH